MRSLLEPFGAGGTAVIVVSIVAAALSARPVLKLQTMAVFERR